MSDTSQKSQEKPAGNTKTAGKGNQLYRYFITLPYEETTASQLSQHLKSFCKKFTFQAEQGENTDYKHWQIELSLNEKLYFDQFKNLLGFDKAHIEPTKSYFQAKNYCSKAETRIEGPYTEKSTFIEPIILTKEWQHKLRDYLLNNKPDYRKIIIIVDLIGGGGKSDFAIWFLDNHRDETIYFNQGSFRDLAHGLPDNPRYIFFDITRTQEEHINWTAIEAMKNGCLFSTKYEGGIKRFNKPHIVIMTNKEPDLQALSADRYDIRYLD